MSVVFLIQSEEQLRTGAPWCVLFSESIDSPIIPVVVGEDRKVLGKHAESTLNEKLGRLGRERVEVQTVAHSVDEVLASCHDAGCRLLVILFADDQRDWQKELFEASPFRTIWLCPVAGPPADEAHLIGGYQPLAALSQRLSMKLLSMQPHSWSVDVFPPADLDLEQRCQLVRSRFDDASAHPETFVVLAIDSVSKDSVAYLVARTLLNHDFGTSVGLVREGEKVVRGIITSFRRWTDSITPPLTRSERIVLQEDLESGSKPSLEFLGLISAASTLASFGLLQNSAAVIIGAMLIAPLMTPILGAGMAITLGNRPLFRTSFAAILLGFAGAFTASVLFGLLVLVFSPPDLSPERATEMWARSNPSPIDFCVGLVGGMAAAYARTRSHLSSALAGAAIAAALVPPISTAGLQFVFGIWKSTPSGTPVLGPLLVVSINVLTIMVGSSLVLWMRGMRVRSGELRKQDRWAVRVLVILVAITLLVLVGLVGV